METDKSLREHLVHLLEGGGAHLNFEEAVKVFPPSLRGKRPDGAAHSPWEVLEHMRIAQWDILEFSRNSKHISPEFPAGYWPNQPAPPSESAWAEAVQAFQADLEAMVALVGSTSDLFAGIPHGEEQTVLREALLVADHNSYHLGELVLLGRLLSARK